jgi:lipid-binding SYLF domain-containing protein
MKRTAVNNFRTPTIETLIKTLLIGSIITMVGVGISVADTGISAENLEDYSDTIALFEKSPEVKPYFENSYGYAVFPNVGKGGVVVGAAYGTGQVYHDGQVTGVAELVEGSIGFQIGGQVFSQIIFFKDERAYEEFTSGEFEFDAGASAVAITAGVQAQTGTTGTSAAASSGLGASRQKAPNDYQKGMATFIHSKGGLMAEATVSGQKFRFVPAD